MGLEGDGAAGVAGALGSARSAANPAGQQAPSESWRRHGPPNDRPQALRLTPHRAVARQPDW